MCPRGELAEAANEALDAGNMLLEYKLGKQVWSSELAAR